jgi:1-acyl-sn-glycerol-3-phosphate acyltransferase
MPEPSAAAESPQLVRDRRTAVYLTAAVCLAAPTVALLVLDVPNEVRRATAIWLVASALVAAVLPFLYSGPYRALGFVPLAALAWLAAAGHGVYWHEWPGWAHGAPLGLIVGALARGRRGSEPVWETAYLFACLLGGVGLAYMFRERGRPFDAAEGLVLIEALVLVWLSWARLFRPLFELSLEPPMRSMYRISGTGPGIPDFPKTGPCLILANHACWFDPIFLAAMAPRPITPMMTSRFYDLPVMHWLMRAFGVIRVPEKALKKDAPEIQEAIAALDRGECVVIFPEGYLRRTDDKALRRFGQGVWQVLKARPNTPVFAAWIEGAWGSYTSYFNGRPTKNKKKDFRRPIAVGMSAATTIPPEELDEHLRTRLYLMNLVSDARRHLGLDPLPRFELLANAKADEPEEEGEMESPAV